MTDNPYGLPAELAKPVAAGWLPEGRATAALLCAALRHERTSGHPAPGTFRVLQHIHAQYLERERMRRDIAEMRLRWEAKRHG